MKIVLKNFEELDGKEVYEISKLRSEVFVVEQNCPYLDLDGKDYQCLHLYFYDDEQKEKEIVCYCRIIPKGLSYSTASIGRVLTNKKYRRKNYARKMMEEAIKIVQKNLGESVITLGGQNYLREFYSSLGFIAISDVYDEDGIPHVDMRLEIK